MSPGRRQDQLLRRRKRCCHSCDSADEPAPRRVRPDARHRGDRDRPERVARSAPPPSAPDRPGRTPGSPSTAAPRSRPSDPRRNSTTTTRPRRVSRTGSAAGPAAEPTAGRRPDGSPATPHGVPESAAPVAAATPSGAVRGRGTAAIVGIAAPAPRPALPSAPGRGAAGWPRPLDSEPRLPATATPIAASKIERSFDRTHVRPVYQIRANPVERHDALSRTDV